MQSDFTRRGVLAAGHWIVDHVKVIDAWPAQDALANILDESVGNGGGAYNMLKNLARLGAPFPLQAAGLVGEDPTGDRILADCRAHGIDATALRATSRAPTGHTDVMTVRDTGRRTFFTRIGANALLGPEHIDFTATRARIFYLGYLLLLDRLDALRDGAPAALDVFARARHAGMITALDMVSAVSDRFATVVSPVLPQVDVCFANDLEAETLTGISLRRAGTLDLPSVEAAAAAMLARGVQRWAIIHFPEGACARSASGETLWQGCVRVPPADILGTAGAGDAFSAGVLFGVHEDWPMTASLELGVCTAAASLYHVTCSESIGSRETCLALGQRFGFHALPA
jgi:sugar/nucleoside kinase (ribokinase family)